MLTLTDSFISALEKWLAAVRAGDMAVAKFHADHLQMHGALLAIHPRFRQSFQKHWPALDPRDALDYLTRFLISTTEIRTEALKNGQAKMVG